MLDVSHDTSAYEVEAKLDDRSRLTPECAQELRERIDRDGFVIVPSFLSDDEAADGLAVADATLSSTERERSYFASQTDIVYRRRDFCPLPSTDSVLRFFSLLARRAGPILTDYCNLGRQVLEISTLTSYAGSSHQYLHRDPAGVLCMFVAVDDVSPEQGGTVLAPGTHPFLGWDRGFDHNADQLMRLFKVQCNLQIMRHNLEKVTKLWRSGELGVSTREFLDRVFSLREDGHQPNLLHFLTSRYSDFNVFDLGPRTLLGLARHGNEAAETFQLVQASPGRGTLILYRSDILHAGADNRSSKPRYFLNMNLARDVIHPDAWRYGYSPHSSLHANPLTLGQLIDLPSE